MVNTLVKKVLTFDLAHYICFYVSVLLLQLQLQLCSHSRILFLSWTLVAAFQHFSVESWGMRKESK